MHLITVPNSSARNFNYNPFYNKAINRQYGSVKGKKRYLNQILQYSAYFYFCFLFLRGNYTGIRIERQRFSGPLIFKHFFNPQKLLFKSNFKRKSNQIKPFQLMCNRPRVGSVIALFPFSLYPSDLSELFISLALLPTSDCQIFPQVWNLVPLFVFRFNFSKEWTHSNPPLNLWYILSSLRTSEMAKNFFTTVLCLFLTQQHDSGLLRVEFELKENWQQEITYLGIVSRERRETSCFLEEQRKN